MRPPEVNDRVMPRRWESGLIEGAGNKSCCRRAAGAQRTAGAAVSDARCRLLECADGLCGQAEPDCSAHAPESDL